MRRYTYSLLVMSLAACGDLQHESPYDPQTPADQQARTTLTGDVTLEPVGGVTPGLAGIQVSVAGQSWSATTDDAGHYSIADVPPGTYTVQAVLTNYVTTSVSGITATLDTGGGTVDVPVLAMKRVRADLAGTVDLMLPDASLETTGGATVSVAPTPGSGPTGLSPSALRPASTTGTGTTDPSGTFVITDLPAPIGTYTLTATRPGYVTQEIIVTFVDGSFLVIPIQLETNPGALVGSVDVVGAANDQGVTIRARGTTLGGTPWEQTTTSDPAGLFRISGLPAGTYTVSYELLDHGTVTTSAAVSPGADTTLDPAAVFHDTGSAGGTVTAQGAASYAGTVVEIAGPDTATALTDAAGTWTVAGLRVGTGYTATYRRVGYTTPAPATFNVTKNQTTPVGAAHLLVATNSSIGGVATVARPSGATASSGILVSVTGADLNGAAVTTSTVTVDGGGYTVSGLPQGTYTLRFTKDSYEAQTAAGIFVAAGQAGAAPSVVLPVASAGLAGAVSLDVSTVPGFGALADRSGTVVTLLDGGVQVESTVTDGSGAYHFASVPALPTSGPTYGISAQRPYFTSGSIAVIPQAGAMLPGNDLTLSLRAGTLTGAVVLWDAVGGGGANPTSAGAQVTISGTAFNGVAWNPAPILSPASGIWTFSALPPGTYDVVVTSSGRSCQDYASTVVPPGATGDAGSRRCTDTIAPGAVGLGQPLATGEGISGWVSGSAVTIPVLQAAADLTVPTTNVRGYQVAVGSAPDWNTATIVPWAATPPTQDLTASGLTTGATNVVWIRAIDWIGNAGPATSVSVVQDSTPPADPTITTARSVLADLTATVVFSGSDSDPSFLRYEACSAAIASTSACDTSPACAFAAAPQSWPVLLASGQRTCIWAQAVDKAGRTSGTVGTSIVSDTAAPTPPIFRPSYDPAAVTVRAEWVDLFLATAPTDAAWGPSWKGIGWIEVDKGAGFQALCPAAACHPKEAYNPCAAGCNCADPMLRCDGTTFTGLRVPLATASSNSIAVRAVDLAGNAGSGLSQEISSETTAGVVAATSAGEFYSRIFGSLVTYTSRSTSGTYSQVLLDLGTNRRVDAGDVTCSVASAWKGSLASKSLIAYATIAGDIVVRRAAAGAALCGADTTTPLGINPNPLFLSASGERIAWSRSSGGNYLFTVREPGVDGTVGTGDDVTTVMAGTYTLNWDVQLAGTQLLVDTYGASTSNVMTHRIFSAPGGFNGSVTTFDLPMGSVPAIALSPDGSMLAYVQSGTMYVRYPTNGRFGAGDALASKPVPTGFNNPDSIAIEGTHVVFSDQNGGAFVHWDAGPNGRFGDNDDLVATLKPSKEKRDDLSLSSGLLVYSENNDVFALDLTSVRWEDVPANYSFTGAVVANASGSVLFGGYNPFYGSTLPLTARCPSGRDTTTGAYSNWFSGDGNYVVAADTGAGLYLHTRDATSGCFFTGSATTQLIFGAAQDPTYYWLPFHAEVSGEVVLLGNQPYSTYSTNIYAVEPTTVGQPLTSGATSVLLSSGIDYPYGLGLTPKQAVYYCGRTGYQICVKGKGTNGLLRDGDAPLEQVLVHPPDAAPALRGLPIPGQHVKVSGNRLIVNTYTSGLLVVDAGTNGTFNDGDDHETVILGQRVEGADYAIGGNWVVYVNGAPPGGDQIFLYNLVDKSLQQLTFHISGKTNVSVDASGRVWWEDSVFGNTWSLWVRTP